MYLYFHVCLRFSLYENTLVSGLCNKSLNGCQDSSLIKQADAAATCVHPDN